MSRWVFPDWADRNLRIILLARLAMSVARAIAGVITALYLDSQGFSALGIGALFVVVTIVSAAMSSAVGLLSDRIGRKPFLVGIPLLAAASAVVYAGVNTPVVLVVFAAIGSFGRGGGAGGGSVGPYQPAESAFAAEAAPAPLRSVVFGRMAFFSSVGALIGGPLAGLVHAQSQMTAAAATAAYRPAFLAAAVFATIAGLLALALIEPDRRPSEASRVRRPIRWPRRSWPVLWRFWVTNGVNGFAIGMFGPFLSYWLYRRYGVDAGTIGILFAVVNLGSLVSTLVAARVGRRFGTVRAIVVVRALSAVLLVPMVLAPTFVIAGAVYVLRMMVQRLGMPLRQAFTQDMADPDERASVAALSNLPAQATMAGSQAFAGYLFDEVSLSAPFLLAAGFQLANAVLYAVLFAVKPPHRRDE